MERAARRLVDLGARAALVKGGHLEGAPGSDDLFFDGERLEWLRGERIPTRHTHGTGCVLSSAIAAHLALGLELLEAVRAGKAFVTRGHPPRPRPGERDRPGGSPLGHPATATGRCGLTASRNGVLHLQRRARMPNL
ncbi:MAG: hypothetical protein KatS3mg014_1763 [Actinomycetota bacterium]|nr:MAG: hypothetical protein KatS3mg014_1763 [Actinomycetota bacterium]